MDIEKLFGESLSFKAMKKAMDDANHIAEAFQRSERFLGLHSRIEQATRRMAEIAKPLEAQAEAAARFRASVGILDETLEETRLLGSNAMRRMESEPLYIPPVSLPRLQAPEPKVSPAVEALQIVQERYEAERCEKETPRRQVLMLITLVDGTQLVMHQLSNEGGHQIRVRGLDIRAEKERTVTVGVQAFQYEFITIDRRPPDLKPVN